MSSDLGRARVIVVDDTRFDRELARSALETVADVQCCGSGEEALEALRHEPADLVLSDLHMPGLSGLLLLERIRREYPGTDFVLLTAHASVDSAIEALRMGAGDYLRKPIQPEVLALVVERALARRKLLRENVRLRDVLATFEACRSLAPCLDPGEIYPVALDLILRSLSRQRGIAVFHRSPVPNQDAVAFRGFLEGQAVRLREILVREKLIDLDTIQEAQILAESPLHPALRKANVEAGRVLAIPVHGEETEAGIVWVLEDDRPFEPSELERALMIAGHAGISLRNAERYTQAKERAFLDDVTGVYNARYLLEASSREIRRAERYGTELSVLFIDVDRFKLVNDHHGHLVGSQVLRELSQILFQCVRQVDTLARYGGDEFTILLVDTVPEACLQVAERIRRTVAETAFEGGQGNAIRFSVSVGVATYPHDGRTREALLEAADKAMYRAKSLGRNRVCAAAELEESS
jgi:diguanylate cyclase (GGDEF)-like protein